MKTFHAFILTGIILFSFFSTAHALDAKTFIQEAFNEDGQLDPSFQSQLDEANAQFQSLPDQVKSLFGNQRIAIDLTTTDGSIEKLGVVMANNQLTSLTNYAPSDSTMTIQTDEETITTITQSPDPAGAFVTAVNQGKLKYEGLSSDATLAVFIANILVFFTNLVKAIAYFLGMG